MCRFRDIHFITRLSLLVLCIITCATSLGADDTNKRYFFYKSYIGPDRPSSEVAYILGDGTVHIRTIDGIKQPEWLCDTMYLNKLYVSIVEPGQHEVVIYFAPPQVDGSRSTCDNDRVLEIIAERAHTYLIRNVSGSKSGDGFTAECQDCADKMPPYRSGPLVRGCGDL
jgi:hypothetical protein